MTDQSKTSELPAAPAGIAPEVWAAAMAQAMAQAKAAPAKSGRKSAEGITELTVETAQKLVDEQKWEAWLKAGSLGSVVILPTIPTNEKGGCYSIAIVNGENKVQKVEPAHVDRVRSPRCFPRAVRMAGTYIGGSAPEFANGPKAKAVADAPKAEVEQPAPEVTEQPKPEVKADEKPARGKGGRKGDNKK